MTRKTTTIQDAMTRKTTTIQDAMAAAGLTPHKAMNIPADGKVRAPRLFTGDTTAERLQVMMGAYSGGAQNLDVFLQSHPGSAMRIDRAGRMAQSMHDGHNAAKTSDLEKTVFLSHGNGGDSI